MERVFDVDDEQRVSLNIIPKTENRDADALMLLLYGARVLAKQQDVNAGQLMAAARTSGLQLSRLDKTLATYGHFITEGGVRRGKRYGLNNQGVNHAKHVLRTTLR